MDEYSNPSVIISRENTTPHTQGQNLKVSPEGEGFRPIAGTIKSIKLTLELNFDHLHGQAF